MPVIQLETVIAAPRTRVFDLSRSVDAHRASAAGTSESAVAGVTTGLLGLDDEVTWQARHLGIEQRLRVKITAFDRPNSFRDEMQSGAFRSMCHDHHFVEHDGVTLMTDRFEFCSPLGWLGRLADRLFLTAYLRRFLHRRNAVLKRLAESDAWQEFVPADDLAPLR